MNLKEAEPSVPSRGPVPVVPGTVLDPPSDIPLGSGGQHDSVVPVPPVEMPATVEASDTVMADGTSDTEEERDMHPAEPTSVRIRVFDGDEFD